MDSHYLKKKLFNSVKKHEDQLIKDGHQEIVHKSSGQKQSQKKGKHPMVQADTRIDISNYLNL